MQIQLVRKEYTKEGIYGVLMIEGSELILSTLEHAYEYPPLPGFKPKVPAGSYQCLRGEHKLSSTPNWFETFEVTGVIGHRGILFHWGNYNKDSDGCILLGKDEALGPNGQKMVTHSKEAFAEFMQALQGIDTFMLQILDVSYLGRSSA